MQLTRPRRSRRRAGAGRAVAVGAASAASSWRARGDLGPASWGPPYARPSASLVGHLAVKADDFALRMEAHDEVAVLPPEAQDALHDARVAGADDDLGLGAGVATQFDPHRALLHGETPGHERLAPPSSAEHTSELQSLMRISY